jgi:hypothetical protein
MMTLTDVEDKAISKPEKKTRLKELTAKNETVFFRISLLKIKTITCEASTATDCRKPHLKPGKAARLYTNTAKERLL